VATPFPDAFSADGGAIVRLDGSAEAEFLGVGEGLEDEAYDIENGAEDVGGGAEGGVGVGLGRGSSGRVDGGRVEDRYWERDGPDPYHLRVGVWLVGRCLRVIGWWPCR